MDFKISQAERNSQIFVKGEVKLGISHEDNITLYLYKVITARN